MAWQLLFILWLVIGHWGYYVEEAYSYFDLAEQIPGYLILIAMVLTSFRFGRSKLSARQWKILHKGGIYFLWGVVWSTYWFELYYYEDIQVIDYVYYWAGFTAWGVRALAWNKKRALQPAT
jgi:DMSO/TMAO reductase YedYZ heme-binding membrane subunit